MAGYSNLSRDQLLQLVEAKDELIKLRDSQLKRLQKRLDNAEDERQALETQLSGFIAQAEVRARQSVESNDCGAGDLAAGSSSSSGKGGDETKSDKRRTHNPPPGNGNDTPSVDSRSMVTDIVPDEVTLGSDGCGFPFARPALDVLDQRSALAAVVPSARTSTPPTALDDVQSIAESQEVDFQALEKMAFREDQEIDQDKFNIHTFPDLRIDVAARPSGTFPGENLKEVGALSFLQTVEEEKQLSSCCASLSTWPAKVRQVEQLIRTDPEAARKLCIFIWGFKEKPTRINEHICHKVQLSQPLVAKPKVGFSKSKGGCATIGCHNESDAACVLNAFPGTAKLWEEPEQSSTWPGDGNVWDEDQGVDYSTPHWGEAKTSSSSWKQNDEYMWEAAKEEIVEYLKAHGGEAKLSVIGGKFQMKKTDFEKHFEFEVVDDPRSTAWSSRQFIVRLRRQAAEGQRTRKPPKVAKVVEHLKAQGGQAKLASVGGLFKMRKVELKEYFDVTPDPAIRGGFLVRLRASEHNEWDDEWAQNEYYEDDAYETFKSDWKRQHTIDVLVRLNSVFGLRPWPIWKTELQTDRRVTGEELWQLKAAGFVVVSKSGNDAKLSWNEAKIRSALVEASN